MTTQPRAQERSPAPSDAGAAHSAGLVRLAGLLADRTRAAFCLALLDGRAWTAGELAAYARVAPSSASEHLTRLTEGGLLVERRQGRRRYVQLASPRVAELLEVLTAHLDPPAAPPRGLRAVNASAALARGRTCYDHLAGGTTASATDRYTSRRRVWPRRPAGRSTQSSAAPACARSCWNGRGYGAWAAAVPYG